MNDGLSYSAMLALNDKSNAELQPPPPIQPGMGSVVNEDPTGGMLAQVQRPAATPVELENRKVGWQAVMEKVTDPNVLRALGFAGAAMSMPGASVGHGLMTGMTAFQAGEYANIAKEREDQELALKTQESGARVEQARATTAETVAKTPGTAAQSRVLEETASTKIAQAQTELEKAKTDLAAAKTKRQVDEIEMRLKKRKADIEASIPDGVLRKAVIAEYEKAEAELKRIRADAGTDEITIELLKGMSKDEQAQFLTKSGKYASTATSAVQQQAAMWAAIYDKLPAEDPQKKGKTREQFQMTQLQSTKAKDITDMMKNYVLAGGDDPEVLSMMGDILKGQLGSRAQPKPAAAAETGWQDAGRRMEYRIKPDGSREVRRKQAPSQDPYGNVTMPE